MAAQLQIFLRGAQHRYDGVPANCGTDTTLQRRVARILRLVFNGDRVDIVADGITACRHFYAAFAGCAQHLIDQILRTLNTFFTDDRFDRL